MQKLTTALIAASIAATPAAAHACDINEARFALAAADIATTIYAIEEKGAHEGNPVARLIVGKKPSPAEVILFRVGSAAIQQAVSCSLPERKRPKFDLWTNVIAGVAVGVNMRFVF